MPKLLSTNTKLAKSVEGHLISGLQLAPSDESGFNTCKDASEGCRDACLFKAGRGAMQNVIDGRIRKTLYFFKDRVGFFSDLVEDLGWLSRKATREAVKAAARLNTISDLPWERIKVPGGDLSILELFPEIQFYDYTASLERALAFARGEMPKNYHLTFSRKEDNEEKCLEAIKAGVNVAVVFDKLPQTFYGRPVIDGDKHDARFLDPKGVVVGLVEKGDAKKDDKGFVIRMAA